jgi:hypothetical protein
MKTAQSGEKDEGEEEDWALYFAYLLSHTSLTKEAIKMSTVPFLKGIINKLPDIVRPNHMCPFLGGSTADTPRRKDIYKEAKEAPTVSAIEAFVRGG